jgi:hypothetical protein
VKLVCSTPTALSTASAFDGQRFTPGGNALTGGWSIRSNHWRILLR